MVGIGLGKFKLENSYSKIIFLAPKVYAGYTENGLYINKVKGFKDPVPFEVYEELLKKNTVYDLYHTKWYRGVHEIRMLKQMYELKQTENKRLIVYDNNDRAIDTIPFKLKNNKKIPLPPAEADNRRPMTKTETDK